MFVYLSSQPLDPNILSQDLCFFLKKKSLHKYRDDWMTFLKLEYLNTPMFHIVDHSNNKNKVNIEKKYN